MRNFVIVFFFFTLFSFLGCKKEGCLESAGSMQLLQRVTTPFHQIYLYDDVNLILTQDTTEWIKVEAGEHLLPNIFTKISDGILTIKNSTKCKWLRNPFDKVNVSVGVKSLDLVKYSGSGNITSTNTIIADKISFYTRDGAGDVNIRLEAKETNATIEYENADFIFTGKTDVCNTYVNSRGSIDFKEFEVKRMNIGYAAVRDATINVTEVLETVIYHTGNLYYKGNPTSVTTRLFSSGKLLRSP